MNIIYHTGEMLEISGVNMALQGLAPALATHIDDFGIYNRIDLTTGAATISGVRGGEAMSVANITVPQAAIDDVLALPAFDDAFRAATANKRDLFVAFFVSDKTRTRIAEKATSGFGSPEQSIAFDDYADWLDAVDEEAARSLDHTAGEVHLFPEPSSEVADFIASFEV